ncbi:hypothetical protein ACFV99_31915 [Streptomyces sp. NPDC059944]|uniref:hypothetical protein n=1 Tax=unclassified Streptomyces TaxID=2593676 RepID=UPI0036615C13
MALHPVAPVSVPVLLVLSALLLLPHSVHRQSLQRMLRESVALSMNPLQQLLRDHLHLWHSSAMKALSNP